MKLTRLISILVLALFISCSTSTSIVSDYDANVNFSSFKSFMFLPWNKKNSTLINDFDKARLYSAVEKEMLKRGYVKKDYGADLAVNLMVIVDKKQETSFTTYYNTYGYYSPFGFGNSTTYRNNYEYLYGTLVIDVFEVSAKKLIWQGAVMKEIDENSTNKDAKINSMVARIFNKYPI